MEPGQATHLEFADHAPVSAALLICATLSHCARLLIGDDGGTPFVYSLLTAGKALCPLHQRRFNAFHGLAPSISSLPSSA